MARKIKLTQLKVNSFVTSLNDKEQKTAKGGARILSPGVYDDVIINENPTIPTDPLPDLPYYWTAIKTQIR